MNDLTIADLILLNGFELKTDCVVINLPDVTAVGDELSNTALQFGLINNDVFHQTCFPIFDHQVVQFADNVGFRYGVWFARDDEKNEHGGDTFMLILWAHISPQSLKQQVSDSPALMRLLNSIPPHDTLLLHRPQVDAIEFDADHRLKCFTLTEPDDESRMLQTPIAVDFFDRDMVIWCYAYALLGMSVMHSKAEVELVHTPRNVARRIKRKTGKTPSPYFDIRVPTHKTIRVHKDASKHVSKQRQQHIVRGHFATYDDSAPLLGKFVGTFWRPSHVRGSKGEAVKRNYHVIIDS